ncbi:MAG: PAAR domain-containing protein [Bryobacteraceae bacterium]|nr:PAAR domain-containing protein [Bryobacteraceae bacterium]
MPQGPAARITDNVAHPLPPVLTPGPGSFNVLIGYLPAWRGVPAAVAGALQAAKKVSDTTIQVAQAATAAAAGTPAAPAVKAAEEATKAAAAAAMGSMITSMAGGADIHMCVTPLPIPPHGPGVVIDGSPTVLINNLPACRLGDTILEAVGPPNKIVKGMFTVIIGQMGRGAPVSAAKGSGQNKGPGQGDTGSVQLNTASQILITAAGKGTPLVACGPG